MFTNTLRRCLLGIGVLVLLAPRTSAQDGRVALSADAPKEAAVTPFIAFRPENRGFSEERMRQLQLADGFEINVFAKDLVNPRMMAVADDGTVYVTEPEPGYVTAMRDADGDGVAEKKMIVLEGLPLVHGIELHENTMYLLAPRTMWRVSRDDDGSLGDPEVVYDDLPDGGQHPNRTAHVGPDGMLYISVGSTCNACDEPNPEHATMLRAPLDGGDRTIFAKGLRNTIGFDWHPVSGQLWGMDHDTDGRGNDIPPAELNLIEEGEHYGWPYVYGKREPDPIMGDPKPGLTKAEFAKQTEPSVLEYQAHSAPMAMRFYEGEMFPERYRNGAFVAMRGSWNRYPAVGYEVVFIAFDENNQPVKFEPFVTGFLIEDGKAHFARLAGLAVAQDGSLLVSDDTNGVVYRVAYAGN